MTEQRPDDATEAVPGPGLRAERRTVGVARAAATARPGAARMTSRASRFTVRQAQRASEAEGAGESGLSRLIQMHFFNTAGDAAVAISLAGSLFFRCPRARRAGRSPCSWG